MSVGKIFKVLIIIVACVIIGALVLNVILPNTATALVNAVEGSIFNATGMSFDLNGDGVNGTTNAQSIRDGNDIAGANAQTNNNAQNENNSANVEGFN